MTTCAFLAMLAIGAGAAFLLGLAVSLPSLISRDAPRNDVWVRHD